MINEADATRVVKKMFAQGQVSSILSDGSILVRIGESYTKITTREVRNTMVQLSRTPTENLTAVAKETVQQERNGASQRRQEKLDDLNAESMMKREAYKKMDNYSL